MKKLSLLLLFSLCLVGCKDKCQDNGKIIIPEKTNITSSAAADSPVNASNLDYYLQAEDAYFYDMRWKDLIRDDGYIKGFLFVPFYEFIAISQSDLNTDVRETLFISQNVYEDGKLIAEAYKNGSYYPRFEQSEARIKNIFPIDKKLLFISQSGFESSLIIELLLQLGYKGSNLYNIGSFNHPVGINSYVDAESHKNLINKLPGISFEIDYTLNTSNLTRIQY